MNKPDPLDAFEQLARRSGPPSPPITYVAAGVMLRIRTAEEQSKQALTLIALGSFVAAAAVCVFGFAYWPEAADPLETLFQLMPPIGL